MVSMRHRGVVMNDLARRTDGPAAADVAGATATKLPTCAYSCPGSLNS
eukprot:CAMPEP_0182561660 /NCGR_PEP_ID=MMETSP1324-20130603/4106_1 /TAXON_ID=236786 /ORGANISM="Florenciella sp., Strain RCC1587" /LENGTH=47 /DNA_ID= /DNA_START= /DNA_END= /DNA_ORIENTATION=